MVAVAVVCCALAAGCSAQVAGTPSTQALPASFATGTAIVGSKLTQAAELTEHPMIASPSRGTPFPTLAWTPSPDEITADDRGKTVQIRLTERVSIVLSEDQYPQANLVQKCVPEGVIGRISNVPAVPPGLYVVRYEGVKPGHCAIRNGEFEVIIDVENAPQE